MKKFIKIKLGTLLLIAFSSCGPNCLNEQRQANSCSDLILASYISCIQKSSLQVDAQLRLVESNVCFSSMIAGFVGCGNQIHPACM